MLFFVKDILKVTGGRLLSGTMLDSFSRAIIDSREAGPGDLFFPLQGENNNGHSYILDALERGAAGVLLENREYKNFAGRAFPAGKAVIAVEDCLQSLQQLARFHRERFKLPLIAVTGSNGKTTTKDFIASVLSKRYHILKTEGNLNNHIGLPLMLLRLTGEHQAAVLEMGMSGYGEIALLASLSRPTLGVITNIGEAHLGMLGNRENIARAKGELLEFMDPESSLFLNADDPYLRRMGKSFHGHAFYFGFAEEAHIKAVNYWPRDPGYCFAAVLPEKKNKETFWIPIPGRHNVYNALAAVAVGNYSNLTCDEIRSGLADADFSAMRMERCFTKSGFWIVNDAYNASPTSVKYVLDFLVEWAGKQKKIAVLGDMFELGDSSEESHLEVGRYAAENRVDYLVTFGEQALFIARGAIQAGFSADRIFKCKEYEETVNCLGQLLEQGAVVLIKGSRGMKMERIAQALLARYN